MTALHTSPQLAQEAAEKLKTFAQAQRLMILSLLLEGEHTVGEIGRATSIQQPALSQQLAFLRTAELVATRRESKRVYYRLASEAAARCVATLAEMMKGSGWPSRSLSPVRVPASTSAAVFARVQQP